MEKNLIGNRGCSGGTDYRRGVALYLRLAAVGRYCSGERYTGLDGTNTL